MGEGLVDVGEGDVDDLHEVAADDFMLFWEVHLKI